MNATFCVQTGSRGQGDRKSGHGPAIAHDLKLNGKLTHKNVKFAGSKKDKEWGDAENALKDLPAVEFTIQRNNKDVTVYAQLNYLVVKRNGTADVATIAVGVEVEKPGIEEITTLANLGGKKISDPAQGRYTCVVEFGETQYVVLLNQ